MALDRKELRHWIVQIRDVLNRDWDPIGSVPDDEYDTYADRIAAMIRDHATDSDIVSYLRWAEMEDMGLGERFDQNRAMKVVAALRSLHTPFIQAERPPT